MPHLLGCEGVGRVTAVGPDVEHLKPGDLTVVPPLSNAWVERVKVSASWLRPLPAGDVEQLSLLGINPPTAALLLSEFVTLKAGDWVVVTAANSAVGRSLVPIARSRGIRTVCVVRRPEARGGGSAGSAATPFSWTVPTWRPGYRTRPGARKSRSPWTASAGRRPSACSMRSRSTARSCCGAT
ncbi:alcohol dehydrogenase catalytic domain-containing protein [Methylobacterium sp. P31]